MNTIELAGVPPVPWRNGGGLTRELLAWPDTRDWRVRISVADVERAGPFSAFPGVQRWFAVLEGEGVTLRVEGAEHRITRQSPPFVFNGGAAVDCELVGGATRDLNFMVRGGTGTLRRIATPMRVAVPVRSLAAVFAQGRLTWQILEAGGSMDLPHPHSFWMEAPL